MSRPDLSPWEHDHRFETGFEQGAERRAWTVLILTLAMMVAEIMAGSLFHSMALLADGWHMSTHAGALGIAAFAYAFARRHADDHRFAFGTGKVGDLAAFSSAILLGVVALFMVWESVSRLWAPETIAFNEAIVVAALGLAVNVASALILGGAGHDHGHHHHDHDHDHAHPHDHGSEARAHHHDHNLRAAYLHVIADAVTSVLAIVALVLGKYLGWTFMDPVMGLAGAAVIANWSVGLMRRSGRVLLDWNDEPELSRGIREAIEAEAGTHVTDLHVWRVGPKHCAAIVSLVAVRPGTPEQYKSRLSHLPELAHVTVEAQAAETGEIRAGSLNAS